jgi:hypothetical protein
MPPLLVALLGLCRFLVCKENGQLLKFDIKQAKRKSYKIIKKKKKKKNKNIERESEYEKKRHRRLEKAKMGRTELCPLRLVSFIFSFGSKLLQNTETDLAKAMREGNTGNDVPLTISLPSLPSIFSARSSGLFRLYQRFHV